MDRPSLKFIKNLYQRILHSIAFYPVLIGFIFFVLAIISLSIENTSFVEEVKKEFSYLFIQDSETSRAILATLITGILSLTVFSFSMVMVVLNQASVNFSPRLLPGLISSKKHQFILGIYIGTLLYCIIALMALGAYGISEHNLGFTTMLAALFGVTCIGLFVYFIHSISGAIQIHNIINTIYISSCKTLDDLIKTSGKTSVSDESLKDNNTSTVLYSNISGFYKGFDKDLLTDRLKQLSFTLEVIPFKDAHVWKGYPIATVNRRVDQAHIKELLYCFSISKSRFSGNSIYSSLSKLMEVAVKALSPGINDPGTAMDVIHILTPLMLKSLALPSPYMTTMVDDQIVLIENSVGADVLMRTIVQPIREYAKTDSAVMACLIEALCYMEQNKELSESDRQRITLQLKACKKDVTEAIVNTTDRDYLIRLIAGAPPS